MGSCFYIFRIATNSVFSITLSVASSSTNLLLFLLLFFATISEKQGLDFDGNSKRFEMSEDAMLGFRLRLMKFFTAKASGANSNRAVIFIQEKYAAHEAQNHADCPKRPFKVTVPQLPCTQNEKATVRSDYNGYMTN